MIEYFYRTTEYRGREIAVCVAIAMQSRGEYCICTPHKGGGFHPINAQSDWHTGNLEQDVLAHEQERYTAIDREHELVEQESVNCKALIRLKFTAQV